MQSHQSVSLSSLCIQGRIVQIIGDILTEIDYSFRWIYQGHAVCNGQFCVENALVSGEQA